MTYDYYQRAQELFGEMVANRRQLHQHPEIAFDLPQTAAYVKDKLREYGLEPQDIGKNGVTALLGKTGGKVLLLRADMDALPIEEASGEDFSSKTPGKMHACGHDMHTAILLTVAKMLKENEANLKGQIKFIFQPAEELLIGGAAMVEAGILENPKVDHALGLHVMPNIPTEGVFVTPGTFMTSANNFRIKIIGKGAHGAMPQDGVDPVYVGAQIVTSVPEIVARELPLDQSAAITMGRFIGDGSRNIIPNEVEIEGTVRTFTESSRDHIKKRLPEIVQGIAQTFRAEAEFEFLSDCPALHNDETFTSQCWDILEEFSQDKFPIFEGSPVYASEDFAYYASQVPSMFYILPTPINTTDELQAVHHPKVRFGERPMITGASTTATIATEWLKRHG